jgi:hypothetical protein
MLNVFTENADFTKAKTKKIVSMWRTAGAKYVADSDAGSIGDGVPMPAGNAPADVLLGDYSMALPEFVVSVVAPSRKAPSIASHTAHPTRIPLTFISQPSHSSHLRLCVWMLITALAALRCNCGHKCKPLSIRLSGFGSGYMLRGHVMFNCIVVPNSGVRGHDCV